MGVKVFGVVDTGRVRLGLRRFTWSKGEWACAAGYHSTEVILPGTRKARASPEGYLSALSRSHADRRWPKTCHLCGRPYEPGDEWQVNQHVLYRLPAGETVVEDDLPPGALRVAWWLPAKTFEGPLGKLLLRLPDGIDWPVYGPAVGDGKPWTISGTLDPMTLTASPSINTGAWHGFLQDGELNG